MKTIKSQFPRNRARKYQAYLLETLRDYHAYIRRVLFPRLDDLQPNVNRDTWSDDLAQIMLAIELYSKQYPDQARVLQEAQAVLAAVEISKRAGGLLLPDTPSVFVNLRPQGQRPSFGVAGARTQERNADILDAWARENVKLITRMRQDEKDAIAGIVTRGFTQGESLKTVKDEIKAQFGVTERRAKLIAQNEMGNLAGALEKREAESIGLRYYTWLTSNDERVRTSHRPLNGMICRWDDPTVYKKSLADTEWKSRASIGAVSKHPSMDVRCRCSSASIIED